MSENGHRRAGTAAELDFDEMRRAMVAEQIRERGVRSPRVLAAMESVPRHMFVPADLAALAYADQPLPIGERQTISQPFMVAAMTDALELTGSENVLEVGTGSGYQTAILSLLAARVTSVEWYASLADAARGRLQSLGYANFQIFAGDGTLGWPDAAPFDAIIVTAAAPSIPPPLIKQLAEGGRLVIPVGSAEQQNLLRVRKRGGHTSRESLHLCRFVPLVGRHGWRSAAS
jgi:protein-L-isoaspartate(D-aspartate) O-methyltransferase